MIYVVLNNRVRMPVLGFGTFQLNPEEAENSVRQALKSGFRLIDTANAYQNERAVGKAIQESGVPREELFVSTKLWPTEYKNENAVEETLERLGLEYIDLLFLHQPTKNWKEGYQLLEKAYEDGKIKAIGISNFEEADINELLNTCKIKPQVIQGEAHPYFWNDKIRSIASKNGIEFMSWYPLGHGDPHLLGEEIVQKIATAHRRSPAQVLLRWHIQCGMVVIPGSKNPQHIWEDFNILDFDLTDREMYQMEALHKNRRYVELTEERLNEFQVRPIVFEEK